MLMLAIALLILGGTDFSSAQEQEVSDDEINELIRELAAELSNPVLNAEQVYDKAVRSTILIITPDLKKGSGVLIDKKLKLAITNKHVVRDHKSVHVFFPARNKDGQLINKSHPENHLTEFYLNEDYEEVLTKLGYATEGNVILKSPDPETDLAIIELKGMPETAEAIGFASPDFDLDASPDVHIVGHPDSRDLWHYDSGKFEKYYDNDLHIEESSAWFGDSGAPVLNDRGKLVGIIWGGERERGIVSYAVPLKDIRSLRSEVKSIQSVYIENSTDSTITYEFKVAEDSEWQEFTIDGVQRREIQVPQPNNQLEKFIVDNPYITQHWAELEGIELVGPELIEFPPGFPKIRFSENNDEKKVLVLETNIQSFKIDNSNDLDQSTSRSNASTYHFSYDSIKEKISLEKGPAPFNFTHVPPIIIQNTTDSTINYEVQWTENGSWQEFTIDGVQWREGPVQIGDPRSNRHWPELKGVELIGPRLIDFSSGFPKIRFNEINNKQKTDLIFQILKTSRHGYSWNNPNRVFLSDAYIYRFSYDSKEKKVSLRKGHVVYIPPPKGWFAQFWIPIVVLIIIVVLFIAVRFCLFEKRHTFSIKNDTEVFYRFSK